MAGVDWAGIGKRILGLFREGAEEFAKSFIHAKIDPIVDNPDEAWAKYGARIDAAVRAACPVDSLDDTIVEIVAVAAKAAMTEFGSDIRDQLLEEAEKINPAD